MANNIFDNIKFQFEKFISLIGNVLAHDKEIDIIQNKLRRHFNTASSDYLYSTDFRSLLNDIHKLFIKNDKSLKYFTLLASLDKQLKAHSIKISGSKQLPNDASIFTHLESIQTCSSTNDPIVVTSSTSSTTDEHSISSSSSPSSSVEHTVEELLDTCNNIVLKLNETQSPTDNEIQRITTDSIFNSDCGIIKREKKINKLERQLSRLSKMIRQLEEKDMSLDEMQHCDLYVVESNLKKQACEIYAKLAELKNQPRSAKRILHQPITLTISEPDHSVIIKALEEMVNQTKFLPTFNDVLETVEKTNDKHKLNLSTDARKNLAEKSFKIIGTEIKTRRMADFNDIMNSRLPEDFNIEQNDPALDSIELENTLVENERVAVIKTEQIFEEFSQIDPDVETEVNIESSEESAAESDDDDEEKGEESESTIGSSDNKLDEIPYDIVDILPPFSSEPSSPAVSESTEPVIEPKRKTNPVEATMGISVNDLTLTILSTASIPLRRSTQDSFDSITRKHEPEVYTIEDDSQRPTVQTIIPRRRDETIYRFCKQRITTPQKRSLTSNNESSSTTKKSKLPPEIITLD